jgi:hypothetical protein
LTGLAASLATRTVVADSSDEDEELGPVAKALLEALKESGKEDLLRPEDDGGQDGDSK